LCVKITNVGIWCLYRYIDLDIDVDVCVLCVGVARLVMRSMCEKMTEKCI